MQNPRIKKTRIFRELVSIYLNKRISRSAAELAYFLTLSIFPMLICLNAMLGSMFPTSESLLEMAEGVVPGATLNVLADYIGYISTNSSRAMVTAGIILMATTAASTFRSFHNIMGEIQGKPRYKGPFEWLISFFFSIVFLAVMYFGVIVVFAGNWFVTFLSEHFSFGVSAAWTWLRFILLFFILFVIIYGIYRLTAPKGADDHILIGTASASVTLVGVSIFFSWFIGMSTRYPLVYGSLASIIILMVWLYLCGNILILGNGLNVALRHERERVAAELKASSGDFDNEQ